MFPWMRPSDVDRERLKLFIVLHQGGDVGHCLARNQIEDELLDIDICT
jgi:hypothetical protein